MEDASFATLLQGVLDRLVHVSFPTIAAIEGVALGAGTQLAVACDLRVATEDAGKLLVCPPASSGSMVNHWTVQRVETLLGPSTARAMLLAARSSRATRLAASASPTASAPCRRRWPGPAISPRSAPLTLAGHKLMLNKLEEHPPPDAEVAAAFAKAWESKDFAEGIDAFRNRRTPVFRGE